MASAVGQGVRTRVSDDRVWLPFTAAHYVEVTNDLAVLDETVPFLDGPALHAGEDESYFLPMVSEEHCSLYEHCARALDLSLSVGSHGLPLIGSGDWNDGMNRVGEAATARASGSAGSFTPRFRRSRSWRMLAGSRPVPRHGGIMRPNCGNRWSGKDGTAVGIGAVTSMTERRLVRPPASNAALIRSRSRGE